MEKFSSPEQPKPTIETIIAELNTDLGYEFHNLTGHNPSEGKHVFQPLMRDVRDNSNFLPLNYEQAMGYKQVLESAINATDIDCIVEVITSPSVHIVVTCPE